jgi:3D (Asp-Asp-Asp) domain-containing protein
MIREISILATAVFVVFSVRAIAQDRNLDQTPVLQSQPNAVAIPPGAVKVGVLKPSFYWVGLETNDGQPKDQKVLDVSGNALVMVSAKFLATLRLEGTGRLMDGRMLNFKARNVFPDGTFEIRYRFCAADAPYGYGFENVPLIPFRSVAIDPKVIPLGSKLFIPEAVGAPLPDGTKHDGYFVASDIGDAIQNQRIDVFTSYGDQSGVFYKVGMAHMKPVNVYIVK